MEFLKGLNPQQQKAVQAGDGPVLVLAGPGSGKTRVLTQRIAYLIGMKGVRPYHILAVTFTNKAAREMGNRVNELLGESAQGVTLGTFHAICARILRREADHLPFNNNFVIFDSDDQLSLVKRAIQELNLDEKRWRAQGLHGSISNAKNELILPEQYPVTTYRDEVVKRVYGLYQQYLLASNALDFDDLLLWTAYLLEENTTVRERYSRRYEYVLVDEFQDTNMAQYVLLKHLAYFHKNIYVVGDTDQSIYRWRGADYRNVERFRDDYPGSQVILLEQNYRSTQAILDVAMAVIDQNPHRIPKQLFTDRGAGQKICLYEGYDDRVEASFVVDTIATLVASKQAEPGDFAVMYRTNAQSRLLEEAFLHAHLPYKLIGAQRFYGRREIKDVLAYLRLVHNPQDEVSLARVINVPTRAIGEKTFLALRQQAAKSEISAGQLLLELGRNHNLAHESFPGRAGSSLAHFGGLLAEWVSLKSDLTPLELVDKVLDSIEYRTYLDDGTDEGAERWENVMELRRLAAEHAGEPLEDFLEEVALVSDQDTIDASGNVPTLLTLHAAKGLEFKNIFIIGLNDGVLPHSRSFEDPEGMMEERRLFYVGITRAMDRLFLTYTQNRSAFGYSEPAVPSRFLDDIPMQMVQEIENSGSSRRGGNGRRSDSDSRTDTVWSPRAKKEKSAAPIQQRYAPGMRVEHPTWGEGMVLNSRLQSDDEIVDVFFGDLGAMKTLAASMARLEIKS